MGSPGPWPFIAGRSRLPGTAALLPLWPVDWFLSVCCWDSSFLFFFFFFLGDAAVVSGRTVSEREQFLEVRANRQLQAHRDPHPANLDGMCPGAVEEPEGHARTGPGPSGRAVPGHCPERRLCVLKPEPGLAHVTSRHGQGWRVWTRPHPPGHPMTWSRPRGPHWAGTESGQWRGRPPRTYPRRGGSLAKASPPRPSAPFRLLFLLFTWWLSLTHPPGQPLLPRRQRFPCCCPPSSSHLSAGGSGRPSFLRLGLHGCPCSSPSCGAGEEAATSPVCFLFLLRRFPGGAAAAVQVSQPWSSVSAMQGFRFFLQGLWGGSLASGGWWGGAWKPPLT